MGLIEKYQDRRLVDRVFDLAWTHSQVLLHQLNATEADAQLYGHLASSVIYANPLLRADASLLGKNRRGQSGLWGYSISGDFPIVLLQIGDPSNIELVRQLVQAHAYWRLKGLAVDLVIWNEDHAGYRQPLQEQIVGLIAAGLEAKFTDRPGGIFLRLGEQISSEDRILFQTVSRAILTDSRGTLWDQIHRRRVAEVPVPHIRPVRSRRDETPASAAAASARPALLQRVGRIHPGRARIRDYDRARPGNAGALGECAGEPELRKHHLGKRPGLHLERERARVPPDSLEQRPRERFGRGSLLHP